MKKFLAVVIILVLVLSVSLSALAVGFNGSSTIQKSGSGIRGVGTTTYTDSSPAPDIVGVYLSLQQKDPSTNVWTTISSVTGAVTTSSTLIVEDEYWYPERGFSYRVRVKSYVNIGGTAYYKYYYSGALLLN